MNAIYRFCQKFGLQHKLTPAYNTQSNGKSKRVIETIKSYIRKLQVTLKQDWGSVLQIAESAYRMMPQEATGISQFLMLYGRKAIMPEEIGHTTYALEKRLQKKAVAGHIAKILNLQEMASNNNEVKYKK